MQKTLLGRGRAPSKGGREKTQKRKGAAREKQSEGEGALAELRRGSREEAREEATRRFVCERASG